MPHSLQDGIFPARLAGEPRVTPLEDGSCRKAGDADAPRVSAASKADAIILRSYALDASSFIPIPLPFEGPVEVTHGPGSGRTDIVHLPSAA